MTLRVPRRIVTHRLGRLWIRRTGVAYDVMFAPTGHGEFRVKSEGGLRAFLWGAAIPADRREGAVAALRNNTEHEIRNVVLTVEQMSKLGL